MNDFILIFIGIFILLLMILLFTLLAYVYNTYVSYTIEINKNLNESEESINNTNTAFNKLQDTVVNNIATVKTNQDIIIENNKDFLNTFDSNILKVININNDNKKIVSLISSNIDTTKPLNIDFNTNITTYKNINSLTNSNQYVNVCNNETDETKRKCINLNIDSNGIFNIYTKNQLSTDSRSNIANISIRDNNNNVMALFDGTSNTIQLGSNINPAITIKNNIYTPNIIVCNYSFTAFISEVTGPSLIPAQPPKLKISFISNFTISNSVFINFNIFNNIIESINTLIPVNGLNSITYNSTTQILKFKSTNEIQKNVINIYEIPINKNSDPVINPATIYNTNGYITDI
jgi:hypothetical protein